MILDKGKIGEKIAVEYLKRNNFEIIQTHFTCRWGEIDIISKKNDVLYFVEVKTRTTLKFGQPEEAINYYKLKSLKRAIKFYITKNKINSKMKLSVIAINLNPDLTPDKIKFYNMDNFDLFKI